MKLDAESLVFALDVNTDGSAVSIEADALDDLEGPSAWRWIHLDRTGPTSKAWLEEIGDLSEAASEALFDEETRPRANVIDDNVVIILRGVNLNPGAEPEDMVALRMLVSGRSVVTLRRSRVFAVQSIRDDALAGRGPKGPGAFVAELAEGLTDRLAGTIDQLEDRVDHLEDQSLAAQDDRSLADELVDVRREIVAYRRFLAPQREALMRILNLRRPWLDEDSREQLSETQETLSRVIEGLDAIRERAAILQEGVAGRSAERMNRTMYTLSIVATVFLPLSFVTGLLGINVGGIPGTQSSLGFVAVCAIIVVLAIVELWIFWRRHWF
ncbi:zinc transporter ZntB [Pararhizobium mangrovi]|uniref:Zinc transporter ZntB n=1 Tax=Pararhizobium mangrovi TaxID=2590452 RepID=A0A506UGB8_9HYPH|nr:zinc transporter ZntB [Pararhizobium mangrovi]TPW32069.1 zinc transporter ZntB [Pararhizobium mangrovi]